MNWVIFIILILAFVFACLITYAGIVYASAKIEVEASPREPMLLCDKHGAFRESHAMEFLEQKMCPFCFNEKTKTKLDSSVIPI